MSRLSLSLLEKIPNEQFFIPDFLLMLRARDASGVEVPVQGKLVQLRPGVLRRPPQDLEDLLNKHLRSLVRPFGVATEEGLPPPRAAEQHLCKDAAYSPHVQSWPVVPIAKQQLYGPVWQRDYHIWVLQIL